MSNNSLGPRSVDNSHIATLSKIDGELLKDLFKSALQWLKINQQIINSLNVFPVPDGDTGTNMFLTLQSALNEITQTYENNAGKIVHLIAQGALMGARGNSGVILSQILRGFARILDDHPEMDAELFVKALAESRNTAYKGVVRPVEGTILTVTKDIARAAEEAYAENHDLLFILQRIVEEADLSVRRTPDLLPILKQAGVVDSGGKGLYFIFDGMLRRLKKMPIEKVPQSEEINILPPISRLQGVEETIEPGQDFEIVVDFVPEAQFNMQSFYADLSKLGTSIQLGEGEDVYRMHIHVPTEKKYDPIDYVNKHGIVKKVYIENLLEQIQNKKSSEEKSIPSIKEDQIAVIAVSPGIGISRIFQSLGVAAIVEGGQSMNPSTEEILKAFKDLPTDKIIILPNNKNIILTAEATTTMSKKRIAIIPTTSVPQGLVACLRLDPEGEYEEIIKEMSSSLNDVETGEITTATRSININSLKVEKGEVIALHNGELVDSAKNLEDASIQLLNRIGAKDKEHITIFYGNNVSKTEVDGVVNSIKSAFPNQEIEVHEGGQPHYQFILSIE